MRFHIMSSLIYFRSCWNYVMLFWSCSGSIVCPGCCRVFTKPAGLGSHFRAHPSCLAQADALSTPVAKTVVHRAAYQVKFKCRILVELIQFEDAGVLFPQTVLRARHVGLAKKNICDWSAQRAELFSYNAQGYGNVRHLVQNSKADNPDAEDDLFCKFIERRDVIGLEAHQNWLKATFKQILGKDSKEPSNGWCTNFQRRFRITNHMRTNKKSSPILERLHLIRGFCTFLCFILSCLLLKQE